MTKLVIVESPAKAKTIGRFLGKEYQVEASFGHVRDLPEKADEIPDEIKDRQWARFGVDIENDFQPYYVVPDSKKKYVERLRKALRQADELLLATDEDREGESISWHLLNLLDPKVPVRRIVFHEITPEAIREALENPRDVDDRLVQAQESRRIMDRLYGYSLSPVLWRKVQSGLSAGRVQSVAVRLIVEREEERRAFKKSVYWDLEAALTSSRGGFTATLTRLGDRRIASGKDFDSTTGELKNRQVVLLGEEDARKLASQCLETVPWRVARVEEKPGTQSPAPPFTTSTMQQEANRKLGYSATRTMRAAQTLYEGVDLGGGERVGLITYMRTDSLTLSERALGEAQKEIARMFGAEYSKGPRRYRTKSRNAQEAHEAIRPTSLARHPRHVQVYLTQEQLRLYELIWKRTLASQMPNAEVLRTTLEIETVPAEAGRATFTATGKRILFPGYLRAYVEGSDDPAADLGDKETILPDLKEGQSIGRNGDEVSLTRVDAKRHETTPPARYTEASLVKKLEEEGIGRPSTYASIINTIQNRGYIFQPAKSKNLVPTFTAMAVTNLLRQHFGDYVDIGFTARMEEELDEVARGEMEWREHVKLFYRGDEKEGGNGAAGARLGLETLIAREKDKIGFPFLDLGPDPETDQPITVRIGRYGPFITRGEGGDGNIATVPNDIAPADFKLEQAIELINKRAEGPREVGPHPETGQMVYAAHGRYGAYVQLGESTKEKGKKPKRASLPKGMTEDEVGLDLAVKLLSLPRELGTHPETGQPVLANIGRFGPYVQMDREFRSLKEPDDPYTVTLERALELLAQPKAGRGASKEVLRELGSNPDGKPIRVMNGRYGPYVTDGKTNVTLPKETPAEEMTLEAGIELLAKKKATKGTKKAAKKSAKKAAKKATKKGAGKNAKKKEG